MVSLYSGALCVFLLLRDVMGTSGTPVLCQGAPHLTYLLATQLPCCVWFEPGPCMFRVMPISSFFGRESAHLLQPP